jgi:hypothetical protein
MTASTIMHTTPHRNRRLADARPLQRSATTRSRGTETGCGGRAGVGPARPGQLGIWLVGPGKHQAIGSTDTAASGCELWAGIHALRVDSALVASGCGVTRREVGLDRRRRRDLYS